ncbi:uncharacterized protein LOC136063338 [Quercus suber]|uniref:uncharacterized protein LOC136063338 n=1 Tax=Quercus suber TaxID=58331 RepID=UPI0032DE81F0
MAHRPLLDDVEFSYISEEDALWLNRLFDEEKVFAAEIMAVFQNFHTQAMFEESRNASFLALIPKKVDAVEIKDFRPISLVGGIYKIISKVLANRLRKVAHGLISDSQKAFVKGRLILDSFLIASECIDSRLSQVFQECCGWSRMLDVATTTSQFSSFSVGNTVGNSVMVSHLLFTNDTLIFCDADPTQIASLRAILARFKEVSGLRINLGKSELVPIGVVHNMDVLVGMLGCRQSSLPLRYLGLPLGAKFKELSIWNPILEKIERRLARWKRLYLSKGGKVTLIKSTLSSLPTYFLSLLPLPGKAANRMEKLQRDFL